MKEQTNIIKIPGTGQKKFRRCFGGYVSTGEEDSSTESDFRGNIDQDGRFFIVRKGHENNGSLNYEARMTGRIYEEDGYTYIEYNVEMSPVFRVCFAIMAVITAAVTGTALYRFFADLGSGMLLPASFFVIAFLIMLFVLIVKPECRAMEKCMDKIAGEFADNADK